MSDNTLFLQANIIWKASMRQMKNVWLNLIKELADNGIWMWFELFFGKENMIGKSAREREKFQRLVVNLWRKVTEIVSRFAFESKMKTYESAKKRKIKNWIELRLKMTNAAHICLVDLWRNMFLKCVVNWFCKSKRQIGKQSKEGKQKCFDLILFD